MTVMVRLLSMGIDCPRIPARGDGHDEKDADGFVETVRKKKKSLIYQPPVEQL